MHLLLVSSCILAGVGQPASIFSCASDDVPNIQRGGLCPCHGPFDQHGLPCRDGLPGNEAAATAFQQLHLNHPGRWEVNAPAAAAVCGRRWQRRRHGAAGSTVGTEQQQQEEEEEKETS